MLRHVPIKHVPVRHMLGQVLKYVPEHMPRYVLEHVPQNKHPEP